MEMNQFKDRMQELAAMVRNDQAMELFTDSYEALLQEVKQDMDATRRTEQVVKMKLMLCIQTGYVLNAYVKYQKMVQGPYSTRMQ